MGSNYRSILTAVTPPIFVQWYKRFKYGSRKDNQSSKHRVKVGGAWDEVGQLQFDFLLESGLLPPHKFLDVGCGSLRGGIHFVEYLDGANYYGMDRQQWLLDAAREVELPQAGLSNKTVHLLCRDDFDFSQFGVAFDFALAQSVFSHLPWNSILRCLVNIEKVLKPDGKFFATFFEDKTGRHHLDSITHIPGGKITYSDRNPFHYQFDVFVELANRVFLNVEYIGDWGHPRNQMMMVFTRPKPGE